VTFRVARGLLIEAEAVAPAAFPALLHALTGSEGHRARLVERARELGLVLDRAGLARTKGGRRLPINSGADLYRHLGPVLRQNRVRFAGRASMRFRQAQADW
jgi:DNA polymerase/3'-5' exonuclease PolX